MNKKTTKIYLIYGSQTFTNSSVVINFIMSFTPITSMLIDDFFYTPARVFTITNLAIIWKPAFAGDRRE